MEDVLAHPVEGLVEVLQAQGFGAFVAAADELFDLTFVVFEEGVHVGLVEETGALGLREDQVGEKEEADPAVEGEPVESVRETVLHSVDTRDHGDVPSHNEVSPRLRHQEGRQDHPVHQPWCELGGIA